VVAGYEDGGWTNGFVAKFDGATGSRMWSRTSTWSGSSSYYYGVTVDEEGNIVASGYGYDPNGFGWGVVLDSWRSDGAPRWGFVNNVAVNGYYGRSVDKGSLYVLSENSSDKLYLSKYVENPLRAALSISASPIVVNDVVTLVLTVTNT